MQLLRLPPRSVSSERKEPSELQGRIDVDRLEVARMDIGARVAGAAAAVSVQGGAHVASVTDAEATLSVTRIDGPGTYKLEGRIDSSVLKGGLSVDEPAHGLLSGLAGLPDLGAVSIKLAIDGPRDAEATRFELAAGPLRASGQGLVDLVSRTVDVDVTATAPAMAPRSDLSWKGMSLQAHVHGPFTRPDATGELRIDELKAGDGQLRSVRADLQGNSRRRKPPCGGGALAIPGPKPALFESAPVDLRADVRLDDPVRPVTFTISHPLVSLRGPREHPWRPQGLRDRDRAVARALRGARGHGSQRPDDIRCAGCNARSRHRCRSQGHARRDLAGAASVPAVVGNAAKIDVVATLRGDEITVKRAQIDGRTLRASAQGTSTRDKLDFEWKLALSDLAALTSSVSGRIEAQGRAAGARDNLEVTAEATGDVGTERFPHGPFKASVRLRGVPGSPSGRIDASGTIDGSPLQIALALERARDGALRSTIERADWKSAHAEGEITLRAGDWQPQGRMAIRVEQLDDLRPWIGRPVQGALTANVDIVQLSGHAQATIQLDARKAGVPGTVVEHVTVAGRIDDPTTMPWSHCKSLWRASTAMA